MMTKITIEFLIPQSENNSFCNNKDAFIHILQADSNIKITKNTLTYNTKQFPFNVSILKAAEKKHLCFHLSIHSEIEALDDFTKLKRLLLKNLTKIFDSPLQVLWDDIDKHYSTIAYPMIKDIENLMRKFLTEFLLINVGAAWIDSSVSHQIKQKADKKPETNNSTFFSSLDFIDLAEFLFEKYTNHNQQIIFANIHKATTIEDIFKIKEMLPRSNWERYFKDALDCEEKLISENWKKLYILRCKIAHNSSFSKKELEQLSTLISEMQPIIIKAIDSLKDIHIPESEKATILVNNIAHENDEGEFAVSPENADEIELGNHANGEYQTPLSKAIANARKIAMKKYSLQFEESKERALRYSEQINDLVSHSKRIHEDFARYNSPSKYEIHNKNISNIRKEYDFINNNTRINPELFDIKKQEAAHEKELAITKHLESLLNTKAQDLADQLNVQKNKKNAKLTTSSDKDNSGSLLPPSTPRKSELKPDDKDQNEPE